MPLNVKLLNKVKKHILAEPNRLRMNNWCIIAPPSQKVYINIYDTGFGEDQDITIPACGTVGCIAGWTVNLGLKKKELKEYFDTIYGARYADESVKAYGPAIAIKAAELLGIPEKDLDVLFFPSSWPAKFEDRYMHCNDQNERAKIVAEVIDDFIAKKA